jgi:aspartate aminotransferase-like enzyme
MAHLKLFIPGPVEVYEDVLQSFATPMIGHRRSEYSVLHKTVKDLLKKALYTSGDVFLVTSSGTGIMEACVRNLVDKKVLHCICGEFGQRWFEISKCNGKNAVPLNVEPGKAIKPDMVDAELAKGGYDCVCVTHNETSTGVMNPIMEIGQVMKKYPDVIYCIDAVSAMMGAKIETDKVGCDVVLASLQKAFAMPPGFAVCAVTKKALEKAAKVPNRGYYFDFIEFKKLDEKDQTPTTPSLPHINGLAYQLDKIVNKEGLDNRFARHIEMAKHCRGWAKENGYELFAEPGYESITLSCIKKRGMVMAAGYGKFKDTSFRIAHMGDTTLPELKTLLTNIDEILKAGLK